jgi:hypothetical protein
MLPTGQGLAADRAGLNWFWFLRLGLAPRILVAAENAENAHLFYILMLCWCVFVIDPGGFASLPGENLEKGEGLHLRAPGRERLRVPCWSTLPHPGYRAGSSIEPGRALLIPRAIYQTRGRCTVRRRLPILG